MKPPEISSPTPVQRTQAQSRWDTPGQTRTQAWLLAVCPQAHSIPLQRVGVGRCVCVCVCPKPLWLVPPP